MIHGLTASDNGWTLSLRIVIAVAEASISTANHMATALFSVKIQMIIVTKHSPKSQRSYLEVSLRPYLKDKVIVIRLAAKNIVGTKADRWPPARYCATAVIAFNMANTIQENWCGLVLPFMIDAI